MANVTFKSEVAWSGSGVLSTADVQGKKFDIDEPVALGGNDAAPNPVEYLLGALGGCINVLVTTFAEQFSVDVKDVNVHIEGDLDPDGFQGKNPNVRPGYQEIRYQISIDSPSPNENVKALIEHVEKVCPVKDTLQGTTLKNIDYISAT
ncbi:OsmC family protein [Virgibacillus ihumii]|uniref:OsmC family protein n=1 Tax=Virgibacillus ihumii TaxID=2686091 RepID=UPI00157C3E49|nr:OsmC family protein [Virgibacillus ihumii]